jgi:hypothetical protein
MKDYEDEFLASLPPEDQPLDDDMADYVQKHPEDFEAFMKKKKGWVSPHLRKGKWVKGHFRGRIPVTKKQMEKIRDEMAKDFYGTTFWKLPYADQQYIQKEFDKHYGVK